MRPLSGELEWICFYTCPSPRSYLHDVSDCFPRHHPLSFLHLTHGITVAPLILCWGHVDFYGHRPELLFWLYAIQFKENIIYYGFSLCDIVSRKSFKSLSNNMCSAFWVRHWLGSAESGELCKDDSRTCKGALWVIADAEVPRKEGDPPGKGQPN